MDFPNGSRLLLFGIIIYFSFFSVITKLCLVQELNMLRTFPLAPFLWTLRLLTPTQLMLNQELNLAQHWDSQPKSLRSHPVVIKLEPQLSESSPLKVHLEGHVTPPPLTTQVCTTTTDRNKHWVQRKKILNIVLNNHFLSSWTDWFKIIRDGGGWEQGGVGVSHELR